MQIYKGLETARLCLCKIPPLSSLISHCPQSNAIIMPRLCGEITDRLAPARQPAHACPNHLPMRYTVRWGQHIVPAFPISIRIYWGIRNPN